MFGTQSDDGLTQHFSSCEVYHFNSEPRQTPVFHRRITCYNSTWILFHGRTQQEPTSGFVAFPIWSRVLLYLLGSLLVIRVGQRPSLFYFPFSHRVNNVVGSLRSLDFPLSIPTLQTFIFAFGYKNPFVEGEDFRDSVKIPVLVS